MIQRKVTTLGYVLFVVATLECVRGLPPTIRIGAIFTEQERGGSSEAAFKYAVHRINRDRALLPNTTLVFDVQYVPAHDTFHAAKKACKLISSGVTAVFGPSDALVGRHVQSMCSALDIPHVEARLDLQPERQGFSINLHPPHRVMVQAYRDFVRYLNWSRVAIVYEDDDGIIKLQDLIRRPPQRNMEIYLRQTEVKTYRDVLRQVRRKEFNNIIVDTRPENMHYFLRAILQLQMNDFNHHYFFTSFDMETFDLEDFKYNYVNMTAFRLVDGEHPLVRQILWDMEKFQPKGQHILNRTNIIEAEPALVYDSVYVFARGLQSLERSATLRLFNVTCEDEIPWNDGSSLFNYVNSVEFRGLTGKIQFKEGRRTNVKLDVVKLKQTSIAKVGEWTESTGVNVTDKAAFLDDTVPNITLVVTTIEEIPYVMVKKNENLTGNARFEGFCIDLLRQLSIMIGFNYVIELVPDRKYGAPDKETGEWNGVVRQLLDKKADLAVAALTINYARESVIDFSKPFLNLGIGILIKVPKGQTTRLFSFLNPLAIEIWCYLLAAYLLVSFTMFVMARFSPYEWDDPHPCFTESDFVENQFSLSNSFWFITGTLLRQGSGLNPKAASTRIVGGIWWFFTLIIISSYTANLAAFLTVERMITPIENVDELAEQSEIAYGTLEGGSTMTFFRDSRMEMYQKMWRYMENKKPSVFVSSYDEGIQRVLEGNYAFLMETTTIDYFVQRNCNLTQVGGQLDSKGYGIATPRGSPWRDKISLAVLEMQEKNVVQVLYNKWWQSMGDTCSREEKSKESKANALGPDNIGGVFVVLLCGLAIAVFVAVLEFCWNSKKNAQTDRQSLCSEMAEELRFAVRCRGSRTRPALRRQCVRCNPDTTYVPANVDLPQENGMLQIMDMHKRTSHHSMFDCADS